MSVRVPGTGLRARLSQPPPLPPFQRDTWTSPLRGPWLASFLSLGLLVLFGICAVTGYLAYVAYQPQLGNNSLTGGGPEEFLFSWDWPTRPSWLFAFTEGSHVIAGVAAVPFLAAKLWTVMPKFYKWPAVKSPADALERGILGLLVGSGIFLLFTGIFNIAYWYPWGFSFVTSHFYAAWVFVGSLLAHIVIKLPVMLRAFRERGVLTPLRADLGHTVPEPPDPETSAPTAPAEPTITRRAWLGVVGGSSLGLVVLLAGDSIGGVFRKISLLGPRNQVTGDGPNGFPINKTAAGVGIKPAETGATWRLELKGRATTQMSRNELLAMPLHTESLTIGCVEGWSTTQMWTGVRLRDLAQRAGVESPSELFVESLQKGGAFGRTTLSAGQATDERALLALKVNGVDLSMDHGFPARVIAPAVPGVHNTKWVKALTFRTAT